MASKSPGKPAAAGAQASEPGKSRPPMLSGGNPQIPKGYGNEPVQAYIDAMPDWKNALGQRLDDIISRTVPTVRKAVKWNTPLYGINDQGWFLGFHCYTKYLKVTFFNGGALEPMPPGASKTAGVRHLDFRSDVPLDEIQFAEWVRQASLLPGHRM